jgi:hypothetical protein
MKMEITIPFKFRPREYQLPFLKALDRGIKRAVIVWNRRSGKDKVCFNYMVKRACERVGTYFYFLPEYTQARKVIWDNIDNDGFKMLDHIPKELIKKTNDTTLKIELINGSIIQLLGADTFAKSGVGTNPIGVVLSEYSVNNPEVWNFIRPILAVNGGWAIFNFTPRGQNHAFKLLEIAKQNTDWFWEVLTVNETKVLTPEEIAKERQEGMSEAMIDQEYYCKFIESATSFYKRIDEVCTLQEAQPNPLHYYQMGVDLAKYQDYTVISVIDLNTFEQVAMERFNQVDWNLQKAKIEAVYHKWGKPIGYIDATGVGDPIVEDLARQGVNLEPIKFNEQNRKDILTNLEIKMEQMKVKLLNNDTLKSELSYFQYELTDQGKLKIVVPNGLHDDTVLATALSVWELPNQPMRVNRMTADYQTSGITPMYNEFGI